MNSREITHSIIEGDAFLESLGNENSYNPIREKLSNYKLQLKNSEKISFNYETGKVTLS